ncbi:MAG: beta-N-acetylhexosaminidase [Bacteroidales bacterium]|nr:beta-N-acetylhexosaminidase [Bacteroidales bacterium]
MNLSLSLRRVTTAALTLVAVLTAQAGDVIPQPLHSPAVEATLTAMPEGTITYRHDSLAAEARYLATALQARGDSRSTARARRARRGIVLLTTDTLSGPEAYRIETTPQRVTLVGGSRAGLFYAIQTLLQQTEDGRLPLGITADAPRYAWRGIMMDEARHFFGRNKVMQLLDLMARYKLNRFHWHLTDEQAWRIEIKAFPRLTEEGGRGTWSEPTTRRLQCYTQQDIRDIVAYAAERHIMVIPEIDMPGHATAANRAYPFLSGGGTKDHPHFTFNVGRDTVYSVLTQVLREVKDLFPAPYLHMGGDEVAFGIKAWEKDADVQALMRREGMTKVKEAEAYFMHRMADSIRALGRTVAGWDELLALKPDTARTLIFWWRHDRPADLSRSLRMGYTTVLCPRRPLYFDFIQHASHRHGRVWNGFCPLEDVYAFPDPLLASLKPTDAERRHIAGLQANVWTERIHTTQRLDFMLLPRMAAVGEAGWSAPERKNMADFERRMQREYRLYDSMDLYYFDPREPQHHPEPAAAERQNEKVSMDFRD